jgi:hypothetical protein
MFWPIRYQLIGQQVAIGHLLLADNMALKHPFALRQRV